jgi:hypothetical protein
VISTGDIDSFSADVERMETTTDDIESSTVDIFNQGQGCILTTPSKTKQKTKRVKTKRNETKRHTFFSHNWCVL